MGSDLQDWWSRVQAVLELSFLKLIDTPASFSGQAKKTLVVTAAEDATEWSAMLPDAHHVRHETAGQDQVDHGGLGGLVDDDHAQYLKEKASGGVAGEMPEHVHQAAASCGQLDHGLALTGLADDDHALYLKEKASGGVAGETPEHSHQAAASCGKLDHGLALDGLGDDDHTQYVDVAGLRAAAKIKSGLDGNKAAVPGVGDIYVATDTGKIYICFVAASWTVIDHGTLTGLADDDHTQYLKEKASGGVAGETPEHVHQAAATCGQLDHGLALTGLADDDHAQYLKEKASGGVAGETPEHGHQAAASCGQLDHGLALTGLADDDHPQYQKTSQRDAASGYAGVDASGIVLAPGPGLFLTRDAANTMFLAERTSASIAARFTRLGVEDFVMHLVVGTAFKQVLTETHVAASDDHAQYLKEKASGGVAGETPEHVHQAAASCGQLDHGLALTGLADDDHTQYSKITSGTYAGNDTVNRAIPHSLGRTPKIVMINEQGGTYGSTIITGCAFISNNLAGGRAVTDPDGTNFYVGNATSYPESSNGSGRTYRWVAMG